ncbi:hypothetical protein PQX77_018679 [Marasmius sp. AFHP31]|nr:hypothetical protein PQX77_018679 [Marasmius sp. AFHP31]
MTKRGKAATSSQKLVELDIKSYARRPEHLKTLDIDLQISNSASTLSSSSKHIHQIMPALSLESSVLEVAEEVTTPSNSGSGLLAKLVAIGVLVVLAAVAAKKWFFPYTIEDLEGLVKSIDDSIKDNMTLGQNLLRGSAKTFRCRLQRCNEEVRQVRIRSIAEPDRAKILAWVIFQWRQMKRVNACHALLSQLKYELMLEIDERERTIRARVSSSSTNV